MGQEFSATIKPTLGMPVSCVIVLDSSPGSAASHPAAFCYVHLGRQQGELRSWGDLDWVPVSWLQPGPDLALGDIWGGKQQLEDLFIYFR